MLPTYLRRQHDEGLLIRIENILREAATELVVLRGGSCTGKTRTAFEAVRTYFPKWQLLFPKDADSLLASLAANAVRPRTVLWLNEAQNYLDDPAGEACAAALRRLLEADGPCIIIATLWPEHYKDLSTSPGLEKAQVKALLEQASVHNVPDHFGTADLAALTERINHDTSLAAAHVASQATGMVTQTLAAGPDLVDHYEHPTGPLGPYGKAIITAAVDARRLGVTSPLPSDFLTTAVPGYLTDTQRANAPHDWETQALAYACTPVRHVISALSPVPHPTGMGACPGVVQLADYLVYHGSKGRRLSAPPESFWDATRRLTSASDLHALANAARLRGRISQATSLYLRITESPGVLALLTGIAHQVGNAARAENHAQHAAELGDGSALVVLAEAQMETGDQNGAEILYGQAAELSNPDALLALGNFRREAREHIEAERLYRQAIDAGLSGYGLTNARRALVDLCGQSGRPNEAEELRRKADSGVHIFYRRSLSDIQQRSGGKAAAERYFRKRAADGDHSALVLLAEMREEAGDHVKAEEYAYRAAEAGLIDGLDNLAVARANAGDLVSAERLARLAADGGSTWALWELARVGSGEPRWEKVIRYGLTANGCPADPWW
ncbi:tetratricopeptide repeat protein [Streptomyces galilaeus]